MGLGPKTLEKLKRLNINSFSEIIHHYPSRYIDFSNITPISKVRPFENCTIQGKIISFQNIFTKNRKNIQKAVVADNTGSIDLIWFNQPYLSRNFQVGQEYAFAGEIKTYRDKLSIFAPQSGPYHTGKIIAVYPETSGLTSKWFRSQIQKNLTNLISCLTDPIPMELLKKHNLLSLDQALENIHSPKDKKLLDQAQKRLAVNEILSLQANSYLLQKEWQILRPHYTIKTDQQISRKLKGFIKSLPFELTSGQKQVWQEVLNDLCNNQHLTNRLIQGDVGSGKTVIAVLASFLNSLNSQTTILLAPTEILAKQHYQSFLGYLEAKDIPVFLLTANSKVDFNSLPNNSIIIGTHAAIFQKEKIKLPISLLIIDEQHKFGVKQRSFLNQTDFPPHCLSLTATPIPRTIGLTMMGSLSLSIIDSLPKNRLPVKTFYVPKSKIQSCYLWLDKNIKTTRQQAFVVCPFIEESESLSSVKSAKQEFKQLQTVFKNLKLELIHGKIPASDRDQIINRFLKGQIDILITTPIIEVGIDIPNATTIIIQSADRFGLASLHQLRGRVGRGSQQSYCYLFSESEDPKVNERLLYLQNHHLGVDIAHYDLQTRGPGELFSFRQHGFPSLKIANLTDQKLIAFSQKVFESILNEYPNLNLKTLIQNPGTSFTNFN